MRKGEQNKRKKAPIKHWSHSSLMAFLRNPLAWYKRYVELVQDVPSTPASAVGRAGHYALEQFYKGATKEDSIHKGLEYLRNIPDFELDFGRAKTKKEKKKKRQAMEEEYLRAVGYYLERAPKHKVVGVEVRGVAEVPGFALPLKAISDLVVESRGDRGALDIVDHKFVASFSKAGSAKTLFVMQALFNYHTVRELYGKPIRRFIVYECKKTANKDGSPQLKRHTLEFASLSHDFKVFERLVNDATEEVMRTRTFLPNPSDMFEGENSFDIYRLGL